MRKFVSYQMPKAKIVQPLLAGAMLLAAAAGGAEAQGCVSGAKRTTEPPPPPQKEVPLTSPGQTAISGDKGCVTGAGEAQRDMPTKKK